MELTEKQVKQFIITVCKWAGITDRINLKQCNYIANLLYNKFGLSVTTLFVERVWNEHRNGGNKQ